MLFSLTCYLIFKIFVEWAYFDVIILLSLPHLPHPNIVWKSLCPPCNIVMEKKFISSLMGLACCDALGTTVEFMHRDSFDKLVDIIGGGPFQLQPGQVSIMRALCN